MKSYHPTSCFKNSCPEVPCFEFHADAGFARHDDSWAHVTLHGGLFRRGQWWRQHGALPLRCVDRWDEPCIWDLAANQPKLTARTCAVDRHRTECVMAGRQAVRLVSHSLVFTQTGLQGAAQMWSITSSSLETSTRPQKGNVFFFGDISLQWLVLTGSFYCLGGIHLCPSDGRSGQCLSEALRVPRPMLARDRAGQDPRTRHVDC